MDVNSNGSDQPPPPVLNEVLLSEELQEYKETSSEMQLDIIPHTLAKEMPGLKRRDLQLQTKLQKFISGQSKTKQDASDTERKCHEFVIGLADRRSTDLEGNEDLLDIVVFLVDTLCQETDRWRDEIHSLEESVALHAVECRASRETVVRLVAEVGRKRRAADASSVELESLRREFECTLLATRNMEMEMQCLKERLKTSQHDLEVSKQEVGWLKKQSEELRDSLHHSQSKAQATKTLFHGFRAEVAALIQDQCVAFPTTEVDIGKYLREDKEDCKEDINSESTIETQAKLSQLLKELALHLQCHQGALQRAQLAEQQLQEVGDRQKEQEAEYQRFLDQLSVKMKLGGITADLSFDMRLQAILLRTQQLVRQEGSVVVGSRTLAHNLQQKLKVTRERLENKELHVDILRRKMEEEKGGRMVVAAERDGAQMAARKLQLKVEHLQGVLCTMRLSNTELKEKLSSAKELKIKVMEQNQAFEEQNRSLLKLEKEKVKAGKILTAVRSELQTKFNQAKEEQQHAEKLLESHHSELKTLEQAMMELAERERQLKNFRKMVCQMLGLDIGTLALPDYEIIQHLERLLQGPHCPHRVWPCLAKHHPQPI